MVNFETIKDTSQWFDNVHTCMYSLTLYCKAVSNCDSNIPYKNLEKGKIDNTIHLGRKDYGIWGESRCWVQACPHILSIVS